MEIDLKNFIEGNDELFMLQNYKEAEVILKDFINYYESEKLKLCEVIRQSEQLNCIHDFSKSEIKFGMKKCQFCDKTVVAV